MKIAVIVPCYNEAASIAKVVQDFQSALPEADIYVYDNRSTDGTAEIAKNAGAIVKKEMRQGKGNVVRRAFADIEADYYLMVDGDATYPAEYAGALLDELQSNTADMVVGVRKEQSTKAYRSGHRFGNWLFTKTVEWIFGKAFNDILSGYRAFSRRFVKSFPVTSSGFDIETEMTVHALLLRCPVSEIEIPYYERAEGSVSKLNTYRDGLRVLFRILMLMKELKPLYFFGVCALLLLSTSLMLGLPLIFTFIETGLVPRFPTAILATGLMVLAWLSLASGIILDSVSRGRLEIKQLLYLK